MSVSFRRMHEIMQQHFDLQQEEILIPELELKIVTQPFESFHQHLLPGNSSYHCIEHNRRFAAPPISPMQTGHPSLDALLNIPDCEIEENIHFRYPVILPDGSKKKSRKPRSAILLLHGLNEKDWQKYLPWAAMLVRHTQKPVILFPIAFHMNRAPQAWSNARLMRTLSKSRQDMLRNISNTSFANTAISARLQQMPERFLWSGLQSYFDIVQLLRQINEGTHPVIGARGRIDIFAYSIGVFLGQILMMANPYNYLRTSRFFCFCGGPTLNRMSPTSRYIMDSEANISIYSYYIEHLNQEMKRNDRLQHYFSDYHIEGNYFRSMLDYYHLQELREQRFDQLGKRIFAVGLKKDRIIPPAEISAVFKGKERNLPVRVKILDFPFDYDHVTPFPLTQPLEDKVNRSANKIFTMAARFLK